MYVVRDIEKALAGFSNQSFALVGPRQAGKTTLLKKKLATVEQGNYLSFDDPDILELFNDDIKLFATRFAKGRIVVLDEVQYTQDGGKKVKYLIDMASKLVWLTGSSEYVLSKKILAPLVGRINLFTLYPFSFREFLKAKKISEVNTASEGELKRLISEHMIFGGYPRIIFEKGLENKKLMLKNILKLITEKDVSIMLGLKPEEEQDVTKIARMLAFHTGSQINYSGLSRELGIKHAKLKAYVAALERAFILKLVPPFYTNKTQELVKSPKIFFIDTGLRNALVGNFGSQRPDMGGLFENYVFTELLKLGFNPKYWRTKSGAEVDFVIEQAGKLIGIEVKTGPGRLTRGTHSFIKKYKPDKILVVCSENKEEQMGSTRVVFTRVENLRKWLIGSGAGKK